MMVTLMTPEIAVVEVEPAYSSATAVQEWLQGQFVGRAIFIVEDPFGMPDRRVDMEGVLLPGGEAFSLEITPSWIRVYVGKTDVYDESVQRVNRQQCDRIASLVADAIGGRVSRKTA